MNLVKLCKIFRIFLHWQFAVSL